MALCRVVFFASPPPILQSTTDSKGTFMGNAEFTLPKIPQFDDQNWTAIKTSLASGLVMDMKQTWQDMPSVNFAPCRVFTGWQDDSLVVYANISDKDIYNTAKELNEPAFMIGDAFEIFCRPLPQLAYYEMHVSPYNQNFQLRIASAKAFKDLCEKKLDKIKEDYLIHKIPFSMFASKTRIDTQEGVWEVFARIPFENIIEIDQPVGVGSSFLVSFSRYDYTRGQAEPVLSSTSPHAHCSYHRQQEWACVSLC